MSYQPFRSGAVIPESHQKPLKYFSSAAVHTIAWYGCALAWISPKHLAPITGNAVLRPIQSFSNTASLYSSAIAVLFALQSVSGQSLLKDFPSAVHARSGVAADSFLVSGSLSVVLIRLLWGSNLQPCRDWHKYLTELCFPAIQISFAEWPFDLNRLSECCRASGGFRAVLAQCIRGKCGN